MENFMKTHSLSSGKLLLLAFAALVATPTFSMIKAESTNLKPQSALILIEDGQQIEESSIDDFITALGNSTSPIIVSFNLVRYFFIDSPEPAHAYMRHMTGLDQRWLIKKACDDIYIFIPVSHLKTNLSDTEISSVLTDNPIENSLVEYKLGLKIEHMQTIAFNDLLSAPATATQSSASENHDYFYNAFGNIFCTKTEYAHAINHNIIDKKFAQPLWSFCMTGHGEGKRRKIAGIKLPALKTILDFFDNSIQTQLLYYFSCYGGGQNAELLYGSGDKEKVYSYTIVDEGNPDSASFSNAPYCFEEENSKEIKIALSMSFGALLSMMNDPSASHREICNSIRDKDRSRLPQIKRAFSRGFNPIFEEDIIRISELANGKNSQTTADEKPNAMTLLIDQQNVTGELIINNPQITCALSMVPGNTAHRIKKISSTVHDEQKIRSWFETAHFLRAPKLFYIEEMGSWKDVIVNTGQYEPYCPYDFFTDQNGTVWASTMYQGSEHPANEEEKIQYNARLASLKSQFQKRRLADKFSPTDMVERIHYASLCYSDKKERNWALREIAKCSLLGMAYLMPGPIQ